MKAVVAAFKQEKALVAAFSVITNLRMELFEALMVRCHCALVQPSRVCLRVLHLLQLVVALRLGHQDSLPGLEHRTLYIR